jgi:ribose transport system ATP-binding protein
MQRAKNILLQARGITKRFGGHPVLNGVDFVVTAGSVHALIGENGAGKSTLVKILCGIHQPDAGELFIHGRKVVIASPRAAQDLGIRVVHQEFSLVSSLSVAENIHLGAAPRTGLAGWRVDRKAMREGAERLLASLGAEIDPDLEVERLTVAERQLVEIARALAGRAEVLILDEPSASLSAAEVTRLLASIDRLKQQGVGLVYVSHRMEEIRRVGDVVTILRDGVRVMKVKIEATNDDQLIEAMIGRKVVDQYPHRTPHIGEALLKIEALSSGRAFDDVNLSVRAGEIVGVVGPVGCGLVELGYTIFGVRPPTGGSLEVTGHKFARQSPRAAMRAGLAYVPEDRKELGLMPKSSVMANASCAILYELSPAFLLDLARERSIVQSLISKLNIVTASAAVPVRTLSGGNQQKVVLGRWLVRGARIFILAEPTRGVDVGAKVAIYKVMNELVQEGAGILLLSSDLMEAIGMCDRLLVMHRGRVVGELSGSELSLQSVLSAVYSEPAPAHAH